MSTAETTETTALEKEQALMADIQQAENIGGRRGRDATAAQFRREQAERARQNALKARVRGDRDAERQLKAADKARMTAAQEHAAALEEGDAAKDVARDARAQLAQHRRDHFDELSESAKVLDAQTAVAAEAAAQALEHYLGLYDAAKGRHDQLTPALRLRVEALDRARDVVSRDDAAVQKECESPEAPIDATTINRIRNLTPLPWAMDERFAPGQPRPTFTVEAPSVPVFFDSDKQWH
jgi:hypothetical protein